MNKQEQIEELKKEIELAKQELADKEAVLNGLLDMLDDTDYEN